jgi:hypothetical protein
MAKTATPADARKLVDSCMDVALDMLIELARASVRDHLEDLELDLDPQPFVQALLEKAAQHA